jgi:formate hydrogenlyase subunit 4
MAKIAFAFVQACLLMAMAPLVSGLIAKLKNNFRMRQGPSVFQPYYNLFKLFSKSEVISENASWIFRIAPFVVLSSAMCASVFLPILFSGSSIGDFLVLIFIFAMGRFFLALAGLDTGSAFGGMGSSREMFISSLAEPVVCLVIFAAGIKCGSTNLAVLGSASTVSISVLMAGVALLMVIIAETSRLPVDNQETHLELTMIHEAMTLEYSGRSLALIEWATHIRQLVWLVLLAIILCPAGEFAAGSIQSRMVGISILLIKIVFFSLVIAVIEVSVAKMRLLRAADYFTFALAIAILAVVFAIWGM